MVLAGFTTSSELALVLIHVATSLDEEEVQIKHTRIKIIVKSGEIVTSMGRLNEAPPLLGAYQPSETMALVPHDVSVGSNLFPPPPPDTFAKAFRGLEEQVRRQLLEKKDPYSHKGSSSRSLLNNKPFLKQQPSTIYATYLGFFSSRFGMLVIITNNTMQPNLHCN